MLIICSKQKSCMVNKYECVFSTPKKYSHMSIIVKNIVDEKRYFCYACGLPIRFIKVRESKND